LIHKSISIQNHDEMIIFLRRKWICSIFKRCKNVQTRIKAYLLRTGTWQSAKSRTSAWFNTQP